MNVLAFRNRQHTRSLNLPLLRRLTCRVLKQEFGVNQYELGFHFVEPEEMARVNQRFLQHEGSTDVITFDHGLGALGSAPACSDKPRQHAGLETGAPNLHGEIFISVADAVKQAREFGTNWQSEVVRYVIHGLLHLRGFDDLHPKKRREMKREENRLFLKMTRQFPLKQIALGPRSQPSTLNSQPR
jgi:probable rRNA maturation factor